MDKSTNTTPLSRLGSFVRRHKVALIILTPIAILLLLAYGIPVIVGDGTGRFSGDKRKVAEMTIQRAYGNEDPMSRTANSLTAFQYYVEDVHELSPQDPKDCKIPEGDDNTDYYLVHLSQVTWFGLRTSSYEYHFDSCIASQKIKNTP